MFTAAGFKTTLEYIELFKQGLICTVSLSALTVIFGFILALILAIMRLSSVCPFRFLALTSDGHLRDRGFLATLSRFNPISFVATVYVEVFRATPMLVQLFMVYYVVFGGVDLPSFKLFGSIRFDRFLPGVVALSLNSGAYLSEIIRSGIMSVDQGQFEAGRSLGLTYVQTMWYIIIPQAFKNVLPALGNEFITLLKETSICGYIALTDVTHGANTVRSQTYEPYMPLFAAALIYLVSVSVLSALISRLERRMRVNER